jgi:EF-P beta-lysylation protein EpmB
MTKMSLPIVEPVNTAIDSSSSWHASLADAIRDANELLSRLGIRQRLGPDACQSAKEFPVLVPESYFRRMKTGDINDPLLRQVLPLDEEQRFVPGFSTDAVQDASFREAPGLLKKYHGRALMIATGSCAVHCRYCFRRHYPYGEEPRRLDEWEPALEAIAADESISEVLLSGGDPLMLSDKRLSDLLERLERIEHLRRVRIHTRLPIVLPNRVTSVLINGLTSSRLTPIVVVHANHANEIVDDCSDALRDLLRAGITVLNQAVLLKGVNDSVTALAELSESLINLGVIPYYLHQLDRVAGTAHFEVPVETGRAIVRELREQLPGYAVPRYVAEIPHKPHKVILE